MKMRILTTIALLAQLAPGVARAVDAPIDRMEASTVFVYSKVSDGYERGSGFLIGDGTYVVTNHHVIADTQGLLVLAKAFKRRVSRIVIDSPEKDLAVLQLEDGIGRPAAVLALSANVKKTQTVLAAGFPGAADTEGDTVENVLEVKFSQGIISGYVKSPNGEALYQISAALNPGNSGGPLFDECGRVIGINVAKSLTQAVIVGPDGRTRTERVPLGEGIGWSIESDELVRLLQTAGVDTKVANSACVPGSTDNSDTTSTAPAASASSGAAAGTTPAGSNAAGQGADNPFTPRVILLSLAAVFAIGILVTVIVVFSGRNQQGTSSSPGVVMLPPLPPLAPPPPLPLPSPVPVALPSPYDPGSSHSLRGLSGTFSNVSFPLSYEPLTLGRNPRVSQIVFKDSDGLVSKRHCTVRIDRNAGGVVVEDCNSTNGTFLDGGERLKGGEPRLVRNGGRFYLGSRDNLFQVN